MFQCHVVRVTDTIRIRQRTCLIQRVFVIHGIYFIFTIYHKDKFNFNIDLH